MQSNITNNKRFQHIINALMLNASFIDNLGLMHGKMGIAIFFFHLSRETQNQIYENYAGELIDEIYEEINNTTPLDFEDGLAGIGWGIEYLVQSGFIEADTDEVLGDFDNRLFQQLIYYTPTDIGLLNGLVGLGAYLLKRIQNPNSNDGNIKTLTNKQLLIHLIDEWELKLTNEEISKLLNFETEQAKNCLGQSTTKETLGKGGTFNIVPDYPLLLWFLAEIYEQNIFNFKVEKIISRLFSPLANADNLPQMHCNRLLLVLAMEKFNSLNIKQFLDGPIDEIIKKLLTGLDRETVLKELTPNSAFMQNGSCGIAWIYNQLFKLTGKDYYQREAFFWNACGFEFAETDQGFAGFAIAKENEDKAFGILNGLAGINLAQL